MVGRVIEIAQDRRHLALDRGFLVVREEGRDLGRIPLDDIAAVLANAHGLTYSNNLLLALLRHGVSVVLCGPNHAPAAILWPVDGHHAQNARMRAQLDATQPLRKRLWKSLVQAKIRAQAAVLERLGKPDGAFERLEKQVRSGDPDNIEAQAARRYWPLLFGTAFRRDPNEPGANGLLNYGYAILRSGTARAVMAAGLHPTLGLHHHNRGNAMCLVDDLMEPFRPVVDFAVAGLLAGGQDQVTPDTKRVLAGLLETDLPTPHGTTPLATVLIRLGASLAQAFEAGDGALALPLKPLPLDWETPARVNPEQIDSICDDDLLKKQSARASSANQCERKTL